MTKKFENRLDKSNIKFNTLNPVWDNEKGTALNVFEMIDLLNELNDKCEFLEIENESFEDGATRYVELYHKSLKENEQLKSDNNALQERNDRQAETIQKLYQLITNKDWKALTTYMEELDKCEEQLQSEWGLYSD